MKIAQVNPGLMSIPPNRWGAIEEIIWQYKTNYEKLGHEVDIVYSDEVTVGKYDLVHLHVGRLANESDHLDGGFIHRKVPYIFTMHDVHSYTNGRDSKSYTDNKLAIEGSIFSTVGCKRFRNIFPSSCRDKLEWLLHGVDTDFFKPVKFSGEHKLLCVGMKEPRKQFHLALQAAQMLNLPITIVGPTHDHCKNYAVKYFESSSYNKLTLIDDSDKESLRNIHNNHSILIHPAICETGNPCLAVMEAMSSGLPVVGTNMDEFDNNHEDYFPDMSNMPGFINCFYDAENIAKRIQTVIENYEDLSSKARQFAENHSWDKVCQRILDIYEFRKDKKTQSAITSDLFDQILAHSKYLDQKDYEQKLEKLGRPHHLVPKALGESWLTFHLKLLKERIKW